MGGGGDGRIGGKGLTDKHRPDVNEYKQRDVREFLQWE